MRDLFPGYYPLTDAEKADVWTTGLVVLDTNALFNLFRYTPSTRQAFLNVLHLKQEQLWLPYQVAQEFQVGRLGIIRDQQEAFSRLLDKTKSALATITTEIGSLLNHPSLDLEDLRRTVVSAVESVEGKIVTTQQAYDADVVARGQHDETTDDITSLYENRVGANYDPERLEEIFALGVERYDKKIPPGFKDNLKPVPERYGDLVLWMQLLDKAEAENRSVLFVSDDQKEDWWREFKGAKIGPRVELIDEFKSRVGRHLQFLTPQQLLAFANERGNAIDSRAVREVGDVSSALQMQFERRGEIWVNDFLSKHGDTLVSSRNAERSVVQNDDKLSELSLKRRINEARLRRALAETRRLEEEGEAGSREYLRVMREVRTRRGNVAALSQQIKEEEFKHLSMRFYHDRVFLARVRELLMRSSVPVFGFEDDWDDVSDSDLAELISPEHADLRDQEFEDILRRAGRELAIEEGATDDWLNRHGVDPSDDPGHER